MTDEEDQLKIEQVIDMLDGNSRKWIQEFADSIGQSYDEVMAAATLYLETGKDTNVGDNMSYNSRWDDFPEFWDRYQKVTGKKVTDKEVFFSCTC